MLEFLGKNLPITTPIRITATTICIRTTIGIIVAWWIGTRWWTTITITTAIRRTITWWGTAIT